MDDAAVLQQTGQRRKSLERGESGLQPLRERPAECEQCGAWRYQLRRCAFEQLRRTKEDTGNALPQLDPWLGRHIERTVLPDDGRHAHPLSRCLGNVRIHQQEAGRSEERCHRTSHARTETLARIVECAAARRGMLGDLAPSGRESQEPRVIAQHGQAVEPERRTSHPVHCRAAGWRQASGPLGGSVTLKRMNPGIGPVPGADHRYRGSRRNSAATERGG